MLVYWRHVAIHIPLLFGSRSYIWLLVLGVHGRWIAQPVLEDMEGLFALLWAQLVGSVCGNLTHCLEQSAIYDNHDQVRSDLDRIKSLKSEVLTINASLHVSKYCWPISSIDKNAVME